MAKTLHFLGTDLQFIRNYEDRTAAEPRNVDVFHGEVKEKCAFDDKITNMYSIRVTRRQESDSDHFFYVLLTGPGFSKSFSGFLFPLLQKNAREYLIDLLNEKICDLAF